ncbi:MAG TPA: polysaccharide ABC transporter ATP-binding protein [Gemmatimonadales bacterium]|nr:polysaccharide ABC transporter ATP-binding protein [Gemmatimonadales bacterium]
MRPRSVGRVEFEAVWKKFRTGELHNRLRDFIPAMFSRAFRPRPANDELAGGEFWAVRDVSFSLGPGDVLGIIGPNGAGKSTVLRLLTRILRPTHGRCHTQGRVGVLIEVAAGFHPDLTGRENIFLQGAIMGMPRKEILRKFDEIVAFSGVEWFLDTPVKRYSSGMHTRLGFAIAAHLDPDVLIIDEALAVGDAAFQRKAFDRIAELARSDIPVVVVSHQLEPIARLCTEAILMSQGAVVKRGTPQECIVAYLSAEHNAAQARLAPTAVVIEQARIEPGRAVASGEWVTITLECDVSGSGPTASEGVGIRIRSAESGQPVFETTTLSLGHDLPRTGRFMLTLDLQLNLPPGVYPLESFVWNRMAGRELGGGPGGAVRVEGGPEFEGTVQMNPRSRLELRAS